MLCNHFFDSKALYLIISASSKGRLFFVHFFLVWSKGWILFVRMGFQYGQPGEVNFFLRYRNQSGSIRRGTSQFENHFAVPIGVCVYYFPEMFFADCAQTKNVDKIFSFRNTKCYFIVDRIKNLPDNTCTRAVISVKDNKDRIDRLILI